MNKTQLIFLIRFLVFCVILLCEENGTKGLKKTFFSPILADGSWKGSTSLSINNSKHKRFKAALFQIDLSNYFCFLRHFFKQFTE